MAIYDEMREQLQELINLLEQDAQYAAAVTYGAIEADDYSARIHQQRVLRIVHLKRNYGLN